MHALELQLTFALAKAERSVDVDREVVRVRGDHELPRPQLRARVLAGAHEQRAREALAPVGGMRVDRLEARERVARVEDAETGEHLAVAERAEPCAVPTLAGGAHSAHLPLEELAVAARGRFVDARAQVRRARPIVVVAKRTKVRVRRRAHALARRLADEHRVLLPAEAGRDEALARARVGRWCVEADRD